MDRIIFSNRKGGRALVQFAIGYVLAAIVILGFRGSDHIWPILAVLAALTLLAVIGIGCIFIVADKKQIAALRQHGDGLIAEMVHVTGNGRKFEIPMTRPQDWSYDEYGLGRRGMKRVADLKLKSGDTTYKLPLFGATIVDVEALRALAPAVIDELLARKLIKNLPA